jgi:N-acyl-D-amino-acid deacylase
MDTLDKLPLGCNVLCYVGHNALRRAAMGSEDRAPTAEEFEKMKALVREAMEHGALGVSFGLAYAPSCYADTQEMIALARVVGEYHGVISAHIRNEGDHVVRAAEEFLTTVRESGARGVYYEQKSGKWRARLRFKRRLISLGTFTSFEEAVKARKRGEELIYGEFLEEMK